MNANKLYGAIGLCMRAGCCICGDFSAERAIKAKKAFIVLLDNEISAATYEKYKIYAQNAGIPCFMIQALGHAIGKLGVKIVAIGDENFGKMIVSAHNSEISN